MKSKHFSEAVSVGCIIAIILLISAERCCGQKLQWSNAEYWEKTPERKALDFSDYAKSIDGKTVSTWALFAGAGAMWGAREAYHAQPDVFERRWGVSKTSWFGSEQWKRNYIGNNPDNPHKSELFGNIGRDMWHSFGLGSKVFIVTGTIAITGRKQPVKYRIVNLLAGLAIQSATASLTYNLLRK